MKKIFLKVLSAVSAITILSANLITDKLSAICRTQTEIVIIINIISVFLIHTPHFRMQEEVLCRNKRMNSGSGQLHFCCRYQ